MIPLDFFFSNYIGPPKQRRNVVENVEEEEEEENHSYRMIRQHQVCVHSMLVDSTVPFSVLLGMMLQELMG